MFSNHNVVRYTYADGTTCWFDPSYGKKYTGSTVDARLLDFQTQSVAGFWLEYDNAAVNKSWLTDSNGGTGTTQLAVMLIAKNTGALQVQVASGTG